MDHTFRENGFGFNTRKTSQAASEGVDMVWGTFYDKRDDSNASVVERQALSAKNNIRKF